MTSLPEKLAHIVAGPNGSGKTTLIDGLLADNALVYLSADKIAFELNREHPEAVAVQAGRELLLQLDETTRRGVSFILETTLAGKSLVQHLKEMKSQGYAVIISFVYLASADENVERVAQRVRKGGHHVPESDVRRRYIRSNRNFWTAYKSIADRWHLYYNGGEGFEKVADGAGDQFVELDANRLRAFLDEIKE